MNYSNEWVIEWLGLYGKDWVEANALLYMAGRYAYMGQAESNGFIQRHPKQPIQYRLTDKALDSLQEK
jgi:hypothetical protein